MTKILVLNPVATDLWDELTRDHLRRIADPTTEIIVRSLEEGPKSIESIYDSEVAARHVAMEVLRAEREGFDAVVINCFDDPGLHAARELASILVLGIGETSILVSLTLGHRIAIISTGRNSPALYHRKALELGVADRVSCTAGIKVGVLEMRRDLRRLRELIVREAVKAVREHGAEVVVLGCGGFIGLAASLSEELGVPVVDPTLITFKVTEGLTKLGLKHSKACLYNPPRRE